MTYKNLASLLALGSSLLLAAACGGNVVIGSQNQGGGGNGGSGGGCAGSAPLWNCVSGCGSDFFKDSVCEDGNWVCPPDSVPIDTCPPPECPGPFLACEVCLDWKVCMPNEECIGSCEAIVCNSCDSGPGVQNIGACACSCNTATNQYGCTLVPGCCNADIDCGDESFVPCVNHVCKQPVMGGCWSNAECGDFGTCVGAIVCPCNADCNGPDTPGTCIPI